jgi:hypothetical protein
LKNGKGCNNWIKVSRVIGPPHRKMENGYTTAMPGKTEIATNLVRRPADGYVMTASGRNVPQPPWIISGDPESAIAYDQWLIEQGRLEAAELDDQWMVCRLNGLEARSMDPALRHLLSDFLFGHANPTFEAQACRDGALVR